MDPGLLECDDWESIQSCLRGFRVAVRWARGWDAGVWDWLCEADQYAHTYENLGRRGEER